jgi:hypothetical protein
MFNTLVNSQGTSTPIKGLLQVVLLTVIVMIA